MTAINVQKAEPGSGLVYRSEVIDRFPFVCVNCMSDERLLDLHLASSARGFGVGPLKDHFKAFDSFPSDHQSLVPTGYRSDPQQPHSGRELILRALNYQIDNGLERAGVAMPPIAACLTAYFYVLTMEPSLADSRFQSGASSMAQRQLSSLLIEFPVLMHPEVHLSFRSVGQVNLTCPTMSVANAVALTRYARLPMATDGLSVEQLTKFANNRCTRLGLTTRTDPLLASMAAKKKKTLFGMALSFSQTQPDLIASLHELSKLTRMSASNRSAAIRRNPYNYNPASSHEPGLFSHLEFEPNSERDSAKGATRVKRTTTNNPSTEFSYLKDDSAYVYGNHFASVYAESFFNACGVIEKQARSPEFLATFRELRMHESRDVADVIQARILDRIFIGNGLAYSAPRVALSVRQVAAGLISAGVVKDPAEAGVWLLARVHHQDILPSASMECVSAFLRALDEYEATVNSQSLDPLRSPRLPSFDAMGIQNPVGDLWKNAARIHEVEKAMTQVINRARGEKVAYAGADTAAVDSVTAETVDSLALRRRARV